MRGENINYEAQNIKGTKIVKQSNIKTKLN